MCWPMALGTYFYDSTDEVRDAAALLAEHCSRGGSYTHTLLSRGDELCFEWPHCLSLKASVNDAMTLDIGFALAPLRPRYLRSLFLLSWYFKRSLVRYFNDLISAGWLGELDTLILPLEWTHSEAPGEVVSALRDAIEGGRLRVREVCLVDPGGTRSYGDSLFSSREARVVVGAGCRQALGRGQGFSLRVMLCDGSWLWGSFVREGFIKEWQEKVQGEGLDPDAVHVQVVGRLAWTEERV